MKKPLLFLLMALLCASSALANPAQDLFDEVSYYLVINYGGLSSANVRELPDRYQPQLDAACVGMANTCPAERAHPVIEAMFRELNDKHSGFFPNFASAAQSAVAGSSTQRTIGITPAWLEGRLYVRWVRSDTAAWRSVERGDQITHINLRPVPANEEKAAALWETLNTKGGVLTLVRQGKTIRVVLNAVMLLPELPSLQMRENRIAILRIPNFFGRGQGSIAKKVHELLAKSNAKAVVLELRDNPGGFVADCTGAAGAFLPKVSNRFTARTAFGAAEYIFEQQKVSLRRVGALSTVIDFPMPVQFTGQVAVLQNSSSASCAEFLASNLQETARAKVYGQPSAGVANTSIGFFFVGDNNLLALSLNTRIKPDNSIHADAVIPDIQLEDNLVTLAQTGKDTILEQAINDLHLGF